MMRSTLCTTLLVLFFAGCGGEDALPGGTTSGGTTSGGTTSGGTTSGGTTSGGTATPPRMVIPTSWQELDAELTKPLPSETEECFASGFTLAAVLALLPAAHDDTLRTDQAVRGTWSFEKDEPVRVTFAPAADRTKATCSAPVKGGCPAFGEAPCIQPQPPTIRFEGTVTWAANGGTAHSFTGAVVGTPLSITVASSDRETTLPAGWTGTWVRYSLGVDPDGFSGSVESTGCSPCTSYVQRHAAFPTSRAISSRR